MQISPFLQPYLFYFWSLFHKYLLVKNKNVDSNLIHMWITLNGSPDYVNEKLQSNEDFTSLRLIIIKSIIVLPGYLSIERYSKRYFPEI